MDEKCTYIEHSKINDFHNYALLTSESVCLFKRTLLMAAGIFFFERYPPPVIIPLMFPSEQIPAFMVQGYIFP